MKNLKNDLSMGPLIAAIVFIVVLSFGALMIASAFTILALNVLFSSEIVPLTWATVFALTWIKFWLSVMMTGIKVKAV
jgi:hypothetical protein